MHPLVWLGLTSASLPPPASRAHPDSAHVVIVAANDVEVSDRDLLIVSSGVLLAPIEVPGDGRLPRDGGNQ